MLLLGIIAWMERMKLAVVAATIVAGGKMSW
jgi:hypothetical protein